MHIAVVLIEFERNLQLSLDLRFERSAVCAPAITQLLPKNARVPCTRVSVPRVQFDSAPDEAQRLQTVVAVRSVRQDLGLQDAFI